MNGREGISPAAVGGSMTVIVVVGGDISNPGRVAVRR
jgi:hypothetical protein